MIVQYANVIKDMYKSREREREKHVYMYLSIIVYKTNSMFSNVR